MQRVFVIDNAKSPLMPCHPARARQLLKAGQAVVWRRYPFTIRLTERAGGETQPTELRLDPGSKVTGLALVARFARGWALIWAAELIHRGQAIHLALLRRAAARRSRRSRHTRYRAPRFANRRRPPGWLPPSLRSRVDNVAHWTRRLSSLCPVTSLAQEAVRFDMQALQNPEIAGVEYQQGTLFGYEVWEYLLVKWGHHCAYCGKENVPLEKDHILPRSRGGSDRVSNLAPACHACNQAKGDQTAAEFGYPDIQAQARRPLKDAAAVNATRRALWQALHALGLPLVASTGGRTRFNRVTQGYPKTHWIDAACVGPDGEHVIIHPAHLPLRIGATGRGSRQMTRLDKYGFPRTSAKAARRVHGFQTGDLVKAVVPAGKHQGVHLGRVAIRTTGNFNLTTDHGTLQGISWKHCRLIQHVDGYVYSKGEMAVPPQD